MVVVMVILYDAKDQKGRWEQATDSGDGREKVAMVSRTPPPPQGIYLTLKRCPSFVFSEIL